MTKLALYTDGACSGNPGPAGIGVVVQQEGAVIKEISRFIGAATNNIAEYTAVICALQEALVLKADEVSLFSDSELVCRQVLGQYKVSHAQMRVLYDQVQHLRAGFRRFQIQHIPREENRQADQLARQAIRLEQAKTVASRKTSGPPAGDHPRKMAQLDFL